MEKDNTTWRIELTEELQKNHETCEDIEHCTLSESALDAEFCPGFGDSDAASRVAFTVWTHNYVYFPATYDGTLWCDSVPRNISDFRKKAVGGVGV